MGQELLAAGWLAPRFGGGIDVWAGILGATLVAMATGYAVGAWRTTRLASPLRLAWLLCMSGVSTLICAVLARRACLPGPGELSIVDSVFAASVVLVVPVGLLSATSPWLVHIYAKEGPGAGNAAGVTYAVSTLGGVVGALLAGYWAIPIHGLWRSTMGCACLLIPAILGCAGMGHGIWRQAFLAIAVLSVVLGLAQIGERRPVSEERSSILLQQDSWYGHHEIVEDMVSRRLMVNGILQTSQPLFGITGPSPTDLLHDGNALGLLPFLKPSGRSVLLIGLGGGSLVRTFSTIGWRVEAVEIDPQVLEIARSYFGYQGDCVLEDGRRYLSRSTKRFDAVILDVYRGEDLPTHLCTLEFFQLVRSRLVSGGVFVMNLIGTGDGADTLALLRTAGNVFPEMTLFAPDEGHALGPMTLYCSAVPLDPAARDCLRSMGLEPLAEVAIHPLNEGILLTDNLNPMPLLRRGVARAWRAMSLRRYGSERSE